VQKLSNPEEEKKENIAVTPPLERVCCTLL